MAKFSHGKLNYFDDFIQRDFPKCDFLFYFLRQFFIFFLYSKNGQSLKTTNNENSAKING